MSNKKRDFKDSVFVKTAGLTKEHYDFIDLKRAKKSRAGFLKSIIEFYLKTNKD